MITLTTERLVLRPSTEDDLEPLAALNTDPEVMRYIGDGSVPPLDHRRTSESIARARQYWDDHGHGLLLVVERETDQVTGWVALLEPAFLPEVLPAVEIGWRLARRFWGQGYATEAATALQAYGFDNCGLDRLVSIRHVDNDRSRRVMEKLGLTHRFDTEVPATGQPVAVHAMTRDEYLVR
ncbi:GNAT family N-acetyltransferase [Streptacidiphilus jiangxiensis]|uniref:Protein N-acetyltransferase, RimJ/RimL family n=1 Tax=Streptacidiphilus jiangxiensis TaxID=235985 RepID=A0A1H7N3C5_STRJI|nr:GNAT family N-acetyltransferase [Streptacidiphilus jiangxiensis]SEL18072.1 Protein N-acetyltransferase, RimJ/RimL family [Streptacidiphilus jiangxiensis]